MLNNGGTVTLVLCDLEGNPTRGYSVVVSKNGVTTEPPDTWRVPLNGSITVMGPRVIIMGGADIEYPYSADYRKMIRLFYGALIRNTDRVRLRTINMGVEVDADTPASYFPTVPCPYA